MSPVIDVIFVPQGAEYQAVVKGLRVANCSKTPDVVPLAIGTTATDVIAQQWLQQQATTQPAKTALLMGLCGGLQAQYGIGTAVLCQACWGWDNAQVPLMADQALNAKLLERIPGLSLVAAITSEKLLHTAQDKQLLARTHPVDIVEMEGYTLFRVLQAAGMSVTMLRVVSDDSTHDLPNVSDAITPDGRLRPIMMALSFLQHPIGAVRLIRGSLVGLQQLERCATAIFRPSAETLS